MSSITLAQAHKVIEAASAKATEIGVPMNVAVVDAGNNLTAFHRQDGAWLGSIDIAQGKAYTARAFDMPTKDLAPEAQPGGSLYGIEASNDGRIIVFAGGIPIADGDEVVGAIGVSGGTVDQDQEVAEAGVAAYIA
ncbi:MAG: heme-binding protein [Solirubrobacteraceae bacterium]|nr:heme-binding protein [Solirubrobacteraceae bacterium]